MTDVWEIFLNMAYYVSACLGLAAEVKVSPCLLPSPPLLLLPSRRRSSSHFHWWWPAAAATAVPQHGLILAWEELSLLGATHPCHPPNNQFLPDHF